MNESEQSGVLTKISALCVMRSTTNGKERHHIGGELQVIVEQEGEIVEHPHEAFGLPTEYMMQRPNKLLFVDEVGSNTPTTKDGNVGGEKFLCEAGGSPQVKAATRD